MSSLGLISNFQSPKWYNPRMKERLHQQHFATAWQTFCKHKALWLLGPIAQFAGSASIIDTLLTSFQMTNVAVQDVSFFTNAFAFVESMPWWAALYLAGTVACILALAYAAQGAIIHTLVAHQSRRQPHEVGHALRHGFQKLPALFGIHLLAFALVVVCVRVAVALITHFTNVPTTILVFAGLSVAIFFILAVKYLTLVFAIGKNQSVPDAVGHAIASVRRYPIIILEHVVLLYLVFTLGVTALFFVTLIILVPFYSLAFVTPLSLETMVATVGLIPAWIAAGVITVFNLSAWSALALRLLKKPRVHSQVVHTVRTYFPTRRPAR
ncbi:hypothetical protein HYV72_01820 [Candidatus Uhrbacteria bacterium]|nr:hypothetical protein [Candidatus Uhrbacteria bacterium]